MTTDPNILTEKDIARMFQCTIQTIQRQARAKKIPGRKVGRRWFFHREVVMSPQFFIQGRRP